ncbi:MAG: cytochrome P450 [Burkholderiaceae bacterium]
MNLTGLAAGFELASPPEGFIDDPYPFYAALRAQEPVRVLANGAVFLTRYDDVAAVYRLSQASSDKRLEFAPKFGATPLFEHHTSSLVFNDPPAHTRVRRLMMGAVNQRAIQRMQTGLQALVARLIDRMTERAADGEPVDLITDYAAAIPIEVIGNLLAMPHAERAPLRDWSLAILSALEPVPSADVLRRGNQAVTDFCTYLRDLVARRRAAPLDPDEDVLTRLIFGEPEGGRLDERELLHNCIFLLNAGHETTTNLIGNGMDALLRWPQQMQRLRQDPGLITTAIEEMLRYESPLQLNNRMLTEAAELAGQPFPAGTFITLGVGAANHDETRFPQAEQFDVGRTPNRHLAFGHGDHACLGMNVARLEGRIAVAGLLSRFTRIERAAPPVRDRRVRFRGFSALPVRLTPA